MIASNSSESKAIPSSMLHHGLAWKAAQDSLRTVQRAQMLHPLQISNDDVTLFHHDSYSCCCKVDLALRLTTAHATIEVSEETLNMQTICSE